MDRTHNDFGQALAPWSERCKAAEMVRAMRRRILGAEKGSEKHAAPADAANPAGVGTGPPNKEPADVDMAGRAASSSAAVDALPPAACAGNAVPLHADRRNQVSSWSATTLYIL
jgi:hypothetical protein